MLALVAAVVLFARPADAHVGSPDIYYDGTAGPYALAITVRMPQVIPGVAEIDVRAASGDVTAVEVVSLRLTGPGSELPPTPDAADRNADDPQLFTASLWLMERGSLQVRIGVDGANGKGVLSLPIPAVAQRTLGMDRGLGALLLGLMLLLALAIVAIVGAAVREAALPVGEQPTRRARRVAAVAIAVASVGVAGLLGFGNWWWSQDAEQYEQQVARPWHPKMSVDGCQLWIPGPNVDLLQDHGHLMHLFVVRDTLDRAAHLHPTGGVDSDFHQELPALPAGHYDLFADVVEASGFPFTGVGELDLPDLSRCGAPTGDDALWLGEPTPDARFDPLDGIRAGQPISLRIHAVDGNGTPATDVRPYMGMAGHAMVVRDDLAVFAHLHPYGSVAMPALMLAGAPHEMMPADRVVAPDVSFPYGFPTAGSYHVFVQVRRGDRIETVVAPVVVAP
jgi:hypothetical protein